MQATDHAETRRFDAFDSRMVVLSDRDVQGLHELTVAVNWPHRPEDIRLLLDVGAGFMICDSIDRPLASGFHFPMGPDFATIGMMLTVPRLQALGAGSWILERAMRDNGAGRFLLNSTRQGLSLYLHAGFQQQRRIHQMQGIAIAANYNACALEGIHFRVGDASDHEAICHLDRIAFGADRFQMFHVLFPVSQLRVATRADKVTGYAMLRRFGRGQVIGPVVAETQTEAIALIAPFVQQALGNHLRIDVPADLPELVAFARDAGMARYDTITEMTYGTPPVRNGPIYIMALAAHAWG